MHALLQIDPATDDDADGQEEGGEEEEEEDGEGNGQEQEQEEDDDDETDEEWKERMSHQKVFLHSDEVSLASCFA